MRRIRILGLIPGGGRMGWLGGVVGVVCMVGCLDFGGMVRAESSPSPLPPSEEKPAVSGSKSASQRLEPSSHSSPGGAGSPQAGSAEGADRMPQPGLPKSAPAPKEVAKPEPSSEPIPKGPTPSPEAPGPESPEAERPGPNAPEPKLPRPEVSKPKNAPSTIQGPRELLALFGMDESHFRRLSDGSPLQPGEEELLLKLLFRSVEFPLELLERWAHRQVQMDQLANRAAEHRGEVYWLAGRVQKMTVCQPVPEAAERFMIDKYYLCDLLLEPDSQPAVVYVRTIPKAWLEKAPENERVGVLAFFLKTSSPDPHKPIPVFAGHRIAWYPEGLLGDLGMDVGLLDMVVDRQPILPEERETFYQLLAAMRRAKPEQVFQAARQQVHRQAAAADSVVPLFKEPAGQRERLVLLRGAARKVVRVEVPDADIRSRFGIDHYYEISLFTPDSEGHPLIICVPSLPPDMPTGEGIQYVEEVEVAAFFLKSWSYRVPPPPEAPPEKRSDMIVWKRHAPLLIGPRPIWYPRPQTSPHTVAAVVAGLLFVGAGLGLWWALWRAHRSDQEFRRRFLVNRPQPTPETFLAESSDRSEPADSPSSESPSA